MTFLSDVTRVSDELLADMWNNIDWKRAEARLADLQAQITQAVIDHDKERRRALEDEIVEDLDVRCIAVRYVASGKSGPGVDCVRWRTPADCMRAVSELRPDEYVASPLRQIDVVAKGSGKVRHFGVPTYHDKAMARLYSYVLSPIVEATAERKSFAFRPGRSTQDAHAFVWKAFTGGNAPRYAVIADVESYYANIQHNWVMANVPINKDVLREQINAGNMFAGKLFPRGEEGISEANSLSPLIANFMLDGLQTHIFSGLYGDGVISDYDNGNMIRFADDIVVAVRSINDGKRVIELIREFLQERGLRLSPKKTEIVSMNDGFTYLSRTYRTINGVLYSYPSEENIERFLVRLADTVNNWKYSQRKLIDSLNKMLAGWSNYHRYSDAGKAFRRVDMTLQTILLKAAVTKHPHWKLEDVTEHYFIKEHGSYIYTLPTDRSVRVMQLTDVPLVKHNRVRCNLNAYADPEYVEERTHRREINNVSGPYRAIWRRQRGRCHHCKKLILKDEPKDLVMLDPTGEDSLENSAYVHARCAFNELEVFYTQDTLTSFIPYDTLSVLEDIASMNDPKTTHARLPKDWQYNPLKEFFAHETRSNFSMTIDEIEEILGFELVTTARRHKSWWYERDDNHVNICRAWTTEDYEMYDLRLDKGTMRFRSLKPDFMRAYLPPEFTEQRVPADAAYELNQFAASLVKKYKLTLKVKPKRRRRRKTAEQAES